MKTMTFTLNGPMLDFLVLSVIAEGDAYGYQISQIIRRAASARDSTLYPVLRRLQEQGLVVTYDEQYQGRNRRYTGSPKQGAQDSRSFSGNGKNTNLSSMTL